MVQFIVGTPASLWQQLANLCFFSSAYFSDLLIIRFFLCGAYFWMIIAATQGMPLWPYLTNPDQPVALSVDTLVWGFVNILAHGHVFVGLFFFDERRFDLEDGEDTLWRMFYRQSGLSKLLFREHVTKKFSLVEFKEGDIIPTDKHVYIMLEGEVRATVELHEKTINLVLTSGDVFDLKHMHMHLVGQDALFLSQNFKAVAFSDVKPYRFSEKDIALMARNPAAKVAWMSLMIAALTKTAERPWKEDRRERGPIFRPLEDWEEPEPYKAGSGKVLSVPLWHFWHSVRSSIILPWPFMHWVAGLRHSGLPAPPSQCPRKSKNVALTPDLTEISLEV